MMKIFYVVTIAGIVLLGLVHSAFTFKRYTDFSADAFWFFSAGLALIFAGLGNGMHYRLQLPFTFMCVLLINLLLSCFTVFLAVKVNSLTTLAVAVCSVLMCVACIFFTFKS